MNDVGTRFWSMCDDAFKPLEFQESILIPNTGSQKADSDYGSARLLILALNPKP